MKTHVFEKQRKYQTVTLYLHDIEGQPEILTTDDFKQATETLKKMKATIVYLQDFPEKQHQEWGIRV